MIKRIGFAAARPRPAPDRAWGPWLAGGVAVASPTDVRPVRVAVCETVVDGLDEDPRHAGVALEWFTDLDHVARFDTWLSSTAGEQVAAEIGLIGDLGTSPVIVADEHIMRGADWLEQRWEDGGVAFKHMALARRADGLTPAEFAERWATHAGRVRPAGERDALVIPDEVKGRAYVQNRPRPRPDGDWAYDAINEVWFDDLDGVRARVEWFRANVGDDAQPDLFSANWFLVVRETVLAIG